MKGKLLLTISVLMLLALFAAACQPAAVTEAPAAEQPAAEPTATTAAPEAEPTATEAAAAEPTATEAPAAEGPFWTPELKQAFAAAIDREVIVDRVFEGRNIPAYHMVPPGYPFATEPFLDKYGTRDLEMAIQLLEQAGYTEDNPFVFDLWYPPEHYGTTTADVMQVLKEQLEETGVSRLTCNPRTGPSMSTALWLARLSRPSSWAGSPILSTPKPG